MNVGDKITGREWSRGVDMPPAGSEVKITTRGTIRDNVFTIGCREYELAPLLRAPFFSSRKVGQGHEITVQTTVDTSGRIVVPIPHRDPVTFAQVREYITEIEIVSIAQVERFLPPGLYGCDAHDDHDLVLVDTGVWFTVNAKPRGTRALQSRGMVNGCQPRLRASFHGMKRTPIDPQPIPSGLTSPTLEYAWGRAEQIRNTGV